MSQNPSDSPPEAQILNLNSFDAFEDAQEINATEEIISDQVHIRIQQRNARKCITIVEGLSPDLNLKKILKVMKKAFSCNGAITKNEEYGQVVQMSGDQRENIKGFFISQEIVESENLILHGF